jgi:hypothetical protein
VLGFAQLNEIDPPNYDMAVLGNSSKYIFYRALFSLHILKSYAMIVYFFDINSSKNFFVNDCGFSISILHDSEN